MMMKEEEEEEEEVIPRKNRVCDLAGLVSDAVKVGVTHSAIQDLQFHVLLSGRPSNPIN